MKVAFFEIEKEQEKILQEKFPQDTLIFNNEHLTVGNMLPIQDIEVFSGMMYSVLNKEILQQLPNLKLITTRSTGFDHIDLSYCKERGITVCNVPVYGIQTVSEHTFALILALSRKIIPSVEQTKKGDFSLNGLRGFDLEGKTLGVIGIGNIGKRVVQLALAFGMNVIAYTKHSDETIAKQMKISFVDLDTLLATADIVSLHVPFSPETKHLINVTNIQKFKKGSFLINTARGGIVETEAIILGLQEGILAGAGLDVLEEECNIKEETQLLTSQFLKECDIKTQLLNHVLLTKENVIVTPHNAFNSIQALQRIIDTTIENIVAFQQEKPQNIVG